MFSQEKLATMRYIIGLYNNRIATTKCCYLLQLYKICHSTCQMTTQYFLLSNYKLIDLLGNYKH